MIDTRAAKLHVGRNSAFAWMRKHGIRPLADAPAKSYIEQRPSPMDRVRTAFYARYGGSVL